MGIHDTLLNKPLPPIADVHTCPFEGIKNLAQFLFILPQIVARPVVPKESIQVSN